MHQHVEQLRMRPGWRATLLCVLLLMPGSLVAQQRLTTGTVVGSVTDTEGRPVSGAAIALRNSDTGVVRQVIAGDDGRYVIPLIPTGGSWALTVESLGYSTVERVGMRIGAGEVLTRDITLTTAAVPVEGIEVTVSSARTVELGGVVERVSAQQVTRLPVRGRGFTEFLNLSPLVSAHPEVERGGRFAIGGARASGTSLQVDGVDTNNLFFAEGQGSSRSPFAFSLEAIGEIQLITNGFDVEYGNYQGGIVNAITRSGTNDTEASVFYFHRDDALTADNFAGEPPRGFRTSQFGLSASGPVVRDRLHWFATVDLQDRSVPVEAASAAGSGVEPTDHAAVLQALGDVYGVAESQRWFGHFTDVEDNAVGFLRLDWNVNEDHRLTLRYNGSHFHRRYDGLDRFDAITNSAAFTDRVNAIVAELNSVPGSSVTNSVRLQLSREDRPRRPDANGGYLPRIDVDLVGEIGGIVRLSLGGDDEFFRNRLEEKKLQVVENLTYRRGRHTLKLGTSNILSDTRHENWVSGNGTYLFANKASLAARSPTSYSRLARRCRVPLVENRAGETVICPDPDIPIADFRAIEWSVYLQDEWAPTDRLTIVSGLRWGGTHLDRKPEAVEGVETVFGVPSTATPSFRGISPRLAFRLDLDRDRRQVLRGGAGILVGRAPLVLAANAFETERPLFRIFCGDSDAPTLDIGEWLAATRGGANPAACRSGSQPTGRPQFTVFDEDFELPRTFKANVGYETRLRADTRLSVDLLLTRTRGNFHVVDLNLAPEPYFRLPDEKACAECEGRPVFVPLTFGPVPFTPRKPAGIPRLRNRGFDRVYSVTSDGEAHSTSLLIELQHRVSDHAEIAGSYALNRAWDNGSFSCCTSYDGFALEPTAGDPGFVGDPGDRGPGTWGPSSTERRHVFVGSLLADAPFGIRVNAVLRMQSGTPWTPIVAGDINADGEDRNDRPWLGRNLALVSAADSALWQHMLDTDACLRDQVGFIAGRNSCRNPAWNALDIRLSREFPAWRNHRAEISLDLYNLLNGISKGMGQYAAVYGERRVLLSAGRFDLPDADGGDTGLSGAPAGRIIYRVNPGFGRLRQLGFDPLQFQAQLGLRYRF